MLSRDKVAEVAVLVTEVVSEVAEVVVGEVVRISRDRLAEHSLQVVR